MPLLLPQMTVARKLPLRTKIAIVFMYKANFMLNFTIIMPQIAYLYLFLVNSYFAKAQKMGARVSDMMTMKELEDYRFFAQI